MAWRRFGAGTPRRGALGRWATALLPFVAPLAMLSAAPPREDTGLYTKEQAGRGKGLYEAKCAACHGAALRGGPAPPLAGPVFAVNWSAQGVWAGMRGESFTVDDLFFVMSTTMPPGAARSLSPPEHAAILAYVLEQNGYPAGDRALAPDSPRLKRAKLEVRTAAPRATPAPAPPETIAGRPESIPAGGGPSQPELDDAPRSTRDWLYHTHDYSGSRYVALDQINSANAGRLQVSCAFQLGEMSTFQTGPIVYDGVMYITTAHTTVALDAATCRPKWRHTWQARARESWLNNRGVAIKDGWVVRGTGDGYLLALNAKSGELVWARKAADSTLGETFAMPPLIYEDLVLIGPAGSENAISGWVGAFRLSDGSPVWKFRTVPGAKEGAPGAWPNPAGIKLGGGAVWTPLSFDPGRGELYVAVTNPAPDLPAGLRPGENLYTNSLVALDVRRGSLRWHKQLVRSDSHDWDLTQVSPLFATSVKGREVNLVATVGKDGVLRALDRDSHQVLYQTPVTTIKNAETPVTTEGVAACPGVLGGVEWNGPAFNPATNMLYAGAVDWCATFWAVDKVRHIPGRLYMGGSFQLDASSQGWITALDAATGEVRWRYRSSRPVVAAVTTTSGNVVFGGELTGDFVVLDARSGDVLYRFNTGGPIGGGIVTYQLQGKQYVAVMSGRPSIAFAPAEAAGAPTAFVFALP